MTKRILDIVLAGALVVVVMPICLVLAAVICLDSKGGPFYFSLRVGKKGKHFRMMKFRTMSERASDRLNEQQQLELSEHFKLRDDPRVTRVGRWMRKYSLDEIPQLLNVLKGEMSLVGPRPKLPEEIELFRESKDELLSVLPGVTGYWQVHRTSAKSDCTMREMDLYYVRSRSVLRDLVLLFETLFVIARRSNY